MECPQLIKETDCRASLVKGVREGKWKANAEGNVHSIQSGTLVHSRPLLGKDCARNLQMYRTRSAVNSIECLNLLRYSCLSSKSLVMLLHHKVRIVLDTTVGKTTSSQRHTLPIWDDMHSTSEVIILNNDQHQHQKIISTNNGIN